MVDIDTNERLHILLVENEAERSDLVKQALEDAQIDCRLHRVANLVEAIAYLREDTPYFNAPRPDFVILGQSLEYKCCCELLADVRRNPRFAGLQVLGLKDPWWQHLPSNNALVPFACCGLKREKVSRLAETIKELEAGCLRNLLRTYG